MAEEKEIQEKQAAEKKLITNEQQNDLTELVFIMDRSGSMSGLEADTIGGFNSMLERQREGEGRVLVSTVLFDDNMCVVHDRLPLEQVKPMTRHDYCVGGCTALLDAVGSAIHHIGNVHKYARPEDRPAKTLVVITTDGLENASHRYSYRKVKKMVERQRERYGWEFIFLGANIDAAEEAERFGVARERAVDYCCDNTGTGLNFQGVGEAIAEVRYYQCLSNNWREKIDQDYKRRGKKH